MVAKIVSLGHMRKYGDKYYCKTFLDWGINNVYISENACADIRDLIGKEIKIDPNDGEIRTFPNESEKFLFIENIISVNGSAQ